MKVGSEPVEGSHHATACVELKHREEDRRSEFDYIKNGPYYVGFDKDAAMEEFKRKWVR